MIIILLKIDIILEHAFFNYRSRVLENSEGSSSQHISYILLEFAGIIIQSLIFLSLYKSTEKALGKNMISFHENLRLFLYRVQT